MISGDGLYIGRNLRDGANWDGKVKAIIRFYFVMGIRGSGRHLSGNMDLFPPGEGAGLVLTCHNDSSLVVDWLCDHSRGQNRAVACFYLDFEARKEQSATNVLGSLLRQMVSGMESIPEEISRAFHEQRKDIGGRRLQLGDIVKMLQEITSSQPAFICIDAVDECGGLQRVGLLDSLKEILGKSSRTRIFLTGRPHIRAEVEKGLAQRVLSVSISYTKHDIIGYLHNQLEKDETPDAMDESLEADILEKIEENIWET